MRLASCSSGRNFAGRLRLTSADVRVAEVRCAGHARAIPGRLYGRRPLGKRRGRSWREVDAVLYSAFAASSAVTLMNFREGSPHLAQRTRSPSAQSGLLPHGPTVLPSRDRHPLKRWRCRLVQLVAVSCAQVAVADRPSPHRTSATRTSSEVSARNFAPTSNAQVSLKRYRLS